MKYNAYLGCHYIRALQMKAPLNLLFPCNSISPPNFLLSNNTRPDQLANFIISLALSISITFASVMTWISVTCILTHWILWTLRYMVHLLPPIRTRLRLWNGLYLLWLHGWISIDTFHLPIHLRLRSAVLSGLARLDLRCVHIWWLAIILLWGKVATKRIIWWGHSLVGWVTWLLRDMLRRNLCCTSGRNRSRALSCSSLRMGCFFTGNNIN